MLKAGLIIIIFCSAFEGVAQEDYISTRWNFKVCYSRFGIHAGYNNYNGILLDYKNGFFQTKKIGQIFIEAHHRATPALEVGTYLGYGKFQIYPDPDTLNFRIDYTGAPFYGVSANFHLLPLLLKKGNPRLDIYIGERFWGILSIYPGRFHTRTGALFRLWNTHRHELLFWKTFWHFWRVWGGQWQDCEGRGAKRQLPNIF